MRWPLLIALVTGCATGAPLQTGRIASAPSMECLPEADIEHAELTPRMRRGWDLAAESFLIPPPPPPRNETAQNLTLWSDEVLAPWLERKTQTVEAARAELDRAAEESHRQRIIGGAIVGLMYEDIARVLAAIPPPEELDDEPEIRAIYADVMRSHARPFLEHARRAYGACAQNAVQPSSMRHWSRFCSGRRRALPGGEGARRLESGETEVEVIVD